MKKIKLLIFLFLPLIVSAQEFKPMWHVREGARISHTQYYVIPSTPDSLDFVGQWYVNATDSIFDGGVDSVFYQYTITSGNTGNAFSMRSDGMLMVLDSTAISYGSDFTLLITTTDTVGTDRSEVDTAFVHIADIDSCYFIDWDAGTNGSGTRSDPYNYAYGNITYQEGYTYLFKRGTTSPNPDRIAIDISNYPTAWTFIAAYDTGARPVLNGAAYTGSAVGVLVGYSTGYPPSEAYLDRYISISDLEIENFDAVSGGNGLSQSMQMRHGVRDIRISRIKSDNSSVNGGIYFLNYYTDKFHWVTNNKVIDCESNYNSHNYAYKLEGQATLTSCWGANNAEDFCTFPWNGGSKLEYCYGYNNSDSGGYDLTIRTSNIEIAYSVFNSPTGDCGVWIADDNETAGGNIRPDSLYIHNSYFKNWYYAGLDFDIYAGEVGMDSILIENNYFQYAGSNNSTRNMIGVSTSNGAVHVSNVTIRGNVFTGNTNAISMNSAYATDWYIYNNLGYNLHYSFLNAIASGSGIEVHDNTTYNNHTVSGYDFKNTTGKNISFENNIYQTRSGLFSPDTANYLYSSGSIFLDAANNNFYPAAGAAIIDSGASTGITGDFVGNSMYGSAWDIGAYEYQGTGTSETASSAWDTLKINLTETGQLATGWNNMTTRSQYDSIQLRDYDDSLTTSYFVIMQDSLYLSSTQGNYPIANYIAPAVAAHENWYWGGTDSQVFKISNVPSGFYGIAIYGSKTLSTQNLDVVASADGDSVQYTAADNDSVYYIDNVYQSASGDLNITFRHLTDGSHLNFIVLYKTTVATTTNKKAILWNGERYKIMINGVKYRIISN